MADQINRQAPPIPQYRKEIRQETLKTVAKMFSDYYRSNKLPINSHELKEKTFKKVKEMDHFAGTEAKTELEYREIMKNKLSEFQRELRPSMPPNGEAIDPLMMATVMINSLGELKAFKEHTEFIGPHDLSLIQQLIQFIESIPVSAHGPEISQADQIQTVKLYYVRLFSPIKETIQNQRSQGPQHQNGVHSIQQPNNVMGQIPQQMMPQQLQQTPQQVAQPQHPQQPQQMQIQSAMAKQEPPVMQQMTPQQQQQQMQPSQPHRMPSPANQHSRSPSQNKPRSPRAPQAVNGVQVQQAAALIVNQQQQAQQQAQLQQQQQVQQQAQVQQQQAQVQQQQVMQQQQMQQQQVMQQQQMQQQQTMQQQQMHQQQAMHQQKKPVQRPQEMTPQTSRDILKQLFSSVRTDCAVFYSTPHPPHF